MPPPIQDQDLDDYSPQYTRNPPLSPSRDQSEAFSTGPVAGPSEAVRRQRLSEYTERAYSPSAYHIDGSGNGHSEHEAALLTHASRDVRNDDRVGESDRYRNEYGEPESGPSRSIREDEQVYPKANSKKARTSTVDADDQREDNGKSIHRRAAQACLRCRRQKLKCLGGCPCDRCTKAKVECDFGQPGGVPTVRSGVVAAEANARLQQLESSVATLLAGLSGSGSVKPPVTVPAGGGFFGEAGVDPASFERRLSGATGAIAPFLTSDGRPNLPPLQPWRTDIPPPLHVRAVEAPHRMDQLPAISASLSPDGQPVPQVRFSSSPNVVFSAPSFSPSNAPSSGISPGSALSGGEREKKEKKLGKGQKAEERLAAASNEGFEPPFRALLYQPAVWDNKEQSRKSSPQPSAETASRDELSGNTYERRFGREKDDPVNTGLVDLATAQTLFAFFVEHCHPFIPIVNVSLPDAFPSIRQSPFLTSAMLAIAARFYIRQHTRIHGYPPLLDPSIPARLANLAETHLGQTLLRKQHALSDVQAILLLAAWGLQSGGKGPDAWIVTGHAARVSRRLGVHLILAQATETARRTEPGSEAWTQLESFMPNWRTWLAWFTFDGLLSLGFGRPQSTQFETVDEQGFLQLRLSQPLPRPGSPQSIALYGDVYIAGQVQLTQIGRDLVNWGEMLADPEKAIQADPRRSGMYRKEDLNVKSMFRELNKRIDDWSKLWVWSGSPYTLYLGSSARIARLQAEHMRLCLNSFALKSRPDTDDFIGQCLKKALIAAQSTIQTHFDSSQTDFALSFATDYLTITLAQAAVFLIRITRAPAPVQAVVQLDSSVAAHYLKMSVDVLEGADMSETKLSTYLAKTIREIARAGGIQGLGQASTHDGDSAGTGGANDADYNGDMASAYGVQSGQSGQSGGMMQGGMFSSEQMLGVPNNGLDGFQSSVQDEPFDLENFLQFESQLDLGYLLGLPGDAGGDMSNGMGFAGNGTVQPWGNVPLQNTIGEFEFGLGMGTGGFGLGWMGLGQGDEGGDGAQSGS